MMFAQVFFVAALFVSLDWVADGSFPKMLSSPLPRYVGRGGGSFCSVLWGQLWSLVSNLVQFMFQMILLFRDGLGGMTIHDLIRGSLNHTFVMKTRNLTYKPNFGLLISTTVLRASDLSVSYAPQTSQNNVFYIRFILIDANRSKNKVKI